MITGLEKGCYAKLCLIIIPLCHLLRSYLLLLHLAAEDRTHSNEFKLHVERYQLDIRGGNSQSEYFSGGISCLRKW